MPLTTLLLLLMVGLSMADESYQGGEWLKRHLQEFTEAATTVKKSASTDSKLLTVQSSQDPRITHDQDGVGGSVSESLLTRTTPMPAMSEMRTRHEMAVCQACLSGDSRQEICKSCEWRNGVYVMQSTYQMEEATTTSETPAEFVPTMEVVDPIDKSFEQQQPVEKSVEQPIDKINISAFVSDFNSDSPDSSSEVKTCYHF